VRFFVRRFTTLNAVSSKDIVVDLNPLVPHSMELTSADFVIKEPTTVAGGNGQGVAP
jgi:hypothetical protein